MCDGAGRLAVHVHPAPVKPVFRECDDRLFGTGEIEREQKGGKGEQGVEHRHAESSQRRATFFRFDLIATRIGV